MDNSLCQWGGGLNAFYWYQIFALDSAVAEVQEMFSSHGGLYSFTFLLYLVLIKLLFVSLPQCNPHIIKIEITTSKLFQLYLSIHLSITLYILSNVVYPYYFELPYLSMNHHASLFLSVYLCYSTMPLNIPPPPLHWLTHLNYFSSTKSYNSYAT